jgi:TRAP-type mannitol/chloroaromatic compound transport system permease large subunit
VESLPSWQVPSNFARQVMENISPVKVTWWSWLSALAGGFLTFIVAFAIYILATGQSVSSLFISLHQTLWGQIKNSSLVFIKFFKVMSAILLTVRQLLESLFKGLLQILTVIKPEVQILIVVTFILASFFIIYGARRKLLPGEKQ